MSLQQLLGQVLQPVPHALAADSPQRLRGSVNALLLLNTRAVLCSGRTLPEPWARNGGGSSYQLDRCISACTYSAAIIRCETLALMIGGGASAMQRRLMHSKRQTLAFGSPCVVWSTYSMGVQCFLVLFNQHCKRPVVLIGGVCEYILSMLWLVPCWAKAPSSRAKAPDSRTEAPRTGILRDCTGTLWGCMHAWISIGPVPSGYLLPN